MLVGRRVEQDTRILRRPRGQHDDARLLHLALFLGVVIFDADGAAAFRVGQHARDIAQGAHFRARFSRLAEIAHHRIGERAGRASDGAPAVINAGVAAFERNRIHAVGHWDQADAVGLGALAPDFAGRKRLHRRHRIGRTGRPPFLFRLGVARHADIGRHLVIERSHVFIGDRPIVAAIVLALHLEVGRQIARKLREVVQRRAANGPSRLIGIGERMLAAEQNRTAGRLQPPAPHVRADQIRQLPFRTVVEHDDFLAGFGQDGGEHRSRRTGADHDHIDFIVCRILSSHGDHHFCVGAMWGM